VVEGRKPLGSKRVTFTRTAVYDPTKVTVYDAKGNKVDPLDLPELLAIPAPVLVSAKGDSCHTRRVKKGAVVLVLPPKPKPRPTIQPCPT
jgi:hypothetical protein